MSATHFLATHWRVLCVVAALVLNAVLATVLVLDYTGFSQEAAYAQSLDALSQVPPTFDALGKFFVRLAESDGAVYAFEVLKRAPLPLELDVHLLGHLVGDELYKQQGITGMKFCTPDFRNACSHTVVIGALLEDGPSVFEQIHDVCAQAPGGKGAYTMCFHGFGHGVLAYAEYEVSDALPLCERVGTAAYQNREYSECVGGVTMEMVSGVHDRALWEQKKTIYMPEDDPLALCQHESFSDEVRGMCYVYITPQLFVAAGANLGNPDPSTFAEAFQFCDKLPKADERARSACFGGFGKEFVVLAQNRDIRKIAEMTDMQLVRIHEWCADAGNDEGERACSAHALSSLYWGGENSANTSIRFCGLTKNQEYARECFAQLIEHVSFYISDPGYRAQFCSSLPESFTSQCQTLLRGV